MDLCRLFRRALADLAGLLDLLRRELHLVRQSLADADEPARFIGILLNPFLEVVGADEEALVEAAGGGPSQ